jgi:hypothetical protein
MALGEAFEMRESRKASVTAAKAGASGRPTVTFRPEVPASAGMTSKR